jgi:SNF2 family DNA or RNA helicase
MNFKLTALGPVSVDASTDGLKISTQPYTDLSTRLNWPTEALDHPDGLKTALEIEQCLELGFAQTDPDGILIPNGSFPDVRRSGIEITTRLAEWSPFLLKIERLSDIGRPDFRYRYSFIHDGQTISFKRIGYFGVRAESNPVYQLDDQTYALVSRMDEFNALSPNEKTRAESWLAFCKVKECATDVGASLDRYLQSNDVIVPKSVHLDIHEWPDGSISFAPQVGGIEGDGLKKAFFNSPTVESFYNVDGPNNSRLRVVFDDRQTEVLERMKGVHRAYGKLKQRLLDKPEVVFEGLMDAVEIRYGRRVEGIGALEAQSISNAARGKSVLELGPNRSDESRPETRPSDGTALSDSPELDRSLRRDFVSEAKYAIESGKEHFVFDGRRIEIDRGLRELIAAKEQKSSPSTDLERGVKINKKYLLPYKDEDDLRPWDIEDARQAKQVVDDSFSLQIPKALDPAVRLKKHQEEGILWLQTCHRLRPHRRGSLLADDMGLGKTLQVLTYLAWCIEHDKELQLSAPTAPWRPILIVVPLILLENRTWEKEINDRFKGGVFDPLLVFHGASIKSLRKSEVKGPEVAVGKPAIPHEVFTSQRVVITNYQTIVNYQHSFAQLLPESQNSIWSVIITDEAQEYKAPPTKISHAIKALHPNIHIACTGTPVENRFLDLWNLVDTIQPALLGTAEQFRERYERDETVLSERVTKLKQNLLFGCRNTFVMRRDKSDVLDLPPKTISPIYADMNDWEISMHRELVGSIGSTSHLAVLHKLVALYQHPTLLEEKGGPLNPQKLLQQSSKLQAVVAKLRDIRKLQEKTVIFAYRVEMQQILAAVISSEFGINVEIINGVKTKAGSQGSSGTQSSKQNRETKLTGFRESRGFNVIILSPFVASIGLTITEANHVIHYGRWWNPAVEAQATDRVYRIGQEKPVFVHLPILRDSKKRLQKSFDESLHEMMLDKQNRAREFLTPLPEEDRLGEELLGQIKGQSRSTNASDPVTSERVDSLPPHLFEALVACLLEDQGHRTILTARSNDHGADVLSFREGEVWIVQVKHTSKDILIGSIAMSDLMAARMSYSTPLSYSVCLMAITNGSFAKETQKEASQHGIRLLDRRELMAQLRASTLTMGRIYTRESDRCKSFDEGIRFAKKWFQG